MALQPNLVAVLSICERDRQAFSVTGETGSGVAAEVTRFGVHSAAVPVTGALALGDTGCLQSCHQGSENLEALIREAVAIS